MNPPLEPLSIDEQKTPYVCGAYDRHNGQPPQLTAFEFNKRGGVCFDCRQTIDPFRSSDNWPGSSK